MKIYKRHDCCATCGYLTTRGYVYGTDEIEYSYFCEINEKKIEYPQEMGGIDKCPCYITKADYKKENKRKIIENHIYPKKSEVEQE